MHKPIDLSQRQIPLSAGLVPTLPPTSVPTDRKPTPVHDSLGTNSLATGQAPIVATKATLIVPSRTRAGIELCNLAAIDIYFGPDSTVTATSGHLLLGVRGVCKYMETQSAIWAIAASAGASLSWAEILD